MSSGALDPVMSKYSMCASDCCIICEWFKFRFKFTSWMQAIGSKRQLQQNLLLAQFLNWHFSCFKWYSSFLLTLNSIDSTKYVRLYITVLKWKHWSKEEDCINRNWEELKNTWELQCTQNNFENMLQIRRLNRCWYASLQMKRFMWCIYHLWFVSYELSLQETLLVCLT